MSEKPYWQQRRDMKLRKASPTAPSETSPADLAKGGGKIIAKHEVPKKTKKPGRPKIRKIAKKRAKELRQYSPIRRKFLQQHPMCELRIDEDCTDVSTEVHHAAGRENGRLLKEEDFKAACRHCHQVATKKSKEAIAAGHSKTRLGKSNKS